MSLRSRLASLRRNLFSRRRVERDLDDELHSYLDHLTEQRTHAGMDQASARQAAHLELGGLEQVKEEVRGVKTGRLIDECWHDLRYAVRMLRKSPSFTLVAIMALALGIGANTAVFSVVNGLLLRPLPYANADRVAVIYMHYAPRDFYFGTMCMRDFLLWKENNRAFENPSLFRTLRMDIGGMEGVPEQVQGASVTSGFFPTFALRPVVGRTFAVNEDQPGSPSLAVISESFWRRRFAADRGVLGRTILVNGAPATVIGVAPVSLQFPLPQTDVWTNLPLNPPTRYGPWFYRGVARLKPGVTFAQAQAETNLIGQRMMQQNPFYKQLALPVVSLRDALLGTTLKPALLILTGAVGLVLLIAVVNVANLMMVRATVRERELALRLSLGAGRARLVRQLLTESLLLALLGGTGGLTVARGGIELIRVWNPGDLPMIDSVRLDPGALGFMLAISLLSGVLFGLIPALHGSRTNLNSAIKEGGRGSGAASHARGRTRSALVVCEIAISLMLLVGSGLLLRSFVNLHGVSGGFATPPRQILTMLISPGNKKYDDAPAGWAFYEEVLRRARNVPGVEKAAVTDSLPPDRQGDADTFGIEGEALAPGDLNPIVSVVTASPSLFDAMHIPLLRGRAFTEHDNTASKQVTVVSEGFAKQFFPGQNPIGKRIRESGPGLGNNWMEIVGIVGNVKYLGLAVDTDPAYYMPFGQTFYSRMFLVVRTSGDTAAVAGELRRSIQSVDTGLTLSQVTTMEQALALSVSQPRFDTMLLGVFAGIALLLAAAGIYGLIAYSVAQRTQEIGVRMALGAAQGDVLRMVLREGASLAAIGISIGMVGAFALTRLLKTMLFGVGTTDVVTFLAAPLAIALVVLIGTFVPALRATRISPSIALRYE